MMLILEDHANKQYLIMVNLTLKNNVNMILKNKKKNNVNIYVHKFHNKFDVAG